MSLPIRQPKPTILYTAIWRKHDVLADYQNSPGNFVEYCESLKDHWTWNVEPQAEPQSLTASSLPDESTFSMIDDQSKIDINTKDKEFKAEVLNYDNKFKFYYFQSTDILFLAVTNAAFDQTRVSVFLWELQDNFLRTYPSYNNLQANESQLQIELKNIFERQIEYITTQDPSFDQLQKDKRHFTEIDIEDFWRKTTNNLESTWRSLKVGSDYLGAKQQFERVPDIEVNMRTKSQGSSSAFSSPSAQNFTNFPSSYGRSSSTNTSLQSPAPALVWLQRNWPLLVLAALIFYLFISLFCGLRWNQC